LACFVGATTPWRIGIKQALGKLEVPGPLAPVVGEGGFHGLAVTLAHAERVVHPPPHHRDPFDRMLVAPAQLEGLTVMTIDPRFRDYDVPLFPFP